VILRTSKYIKVGVYFYCDYFRMHLELSSSIGCKVLSKTILSIKFILLKLQISHFVFYHYLVFLLLACHLKVWRILRTCIFEKVMYT